VIDLPRRYSVDDDLALPYDRRIGRHLDILLNGRLVTHVIAYDSDAGMVERYVAGPDGAPFLDETGKAPKREILHGQITVIRRECDGA
jgi:hypothetical protein